MDTKTVETLLKLISDTNTRITLISERIDILGERIDLLVEAQKKQRGDNAKD